MEAIALMKQHPVMAPVVDQRPRVVVCSGLGLQV